MIWIYIIKNKINKKAYVGSTNNFSRRVSQHKTKLKHGAGMNKELQQDYNKYGAEAFEFIPILLTTEEQRYADEAAIIEQLDAINHGYNVNIPTSRKIFYLEF